MRCTRVTQHVYRGLIPSGRTYDHRCEACGATFETLSPYRLVRDGFLSLLTPPMGLLILLYAIDGPWWSWIVGGLFLLFGAWWIYATGRALAAQLRNPEIDARAMPAVRPPG